MVQSLPRTFTVVILARLHHILHVMWVLEFCTVPWAHTGWYGTWNRYFIYFQFCTLSWLIAGQSMTTSFSDAIPYFQIHNRLKRSQTDSLASLITSFFKLDFEFKFSTVRSIVPWYWKTFRITVPLWGESIGHHGFPSLGFPLQRCCMTCGFPSQRGSNTHVKLWYFLCCKPL